MYRAILSLGTNIGDKSTNIAEAIQLIERKAGTIVRISSLYITKAWGVQQQPDFINAAVLINTRHTPKQLLQILLQVEKTMGRKRLFKWGPRIIDIDIIFFEDLVLKKPSLHIPHALMHKRVFVLQPIADIAPNWRHPVLKKPVRRLLKDCRDYRIKRYLA